MTDRRRNLYKISYWDFSFMDDETRWHLETDFIESWGEEKAREVFSAMHPVNRTYTRDQKHHKWEIFTVQCVVEDV